MLLVYSMVKHRPGWPWKALEAGVERCGDSLAIGYGGDPSRRGPGCVVLTWHPYGVSLWAAQDVTDRGGAHVVAEHGYLRQDGRGRPLYLLGLGGMHDEACHPAGKPLEARADKLALESQLMPWVSGGDHVLVLGQRGRGYSEYAMMEQWPGAVCRRLLAITDRPILYRPHPGRRVDLPDEVGADPRVTVQGPDRTLEDALRGAHCAVAWTSNALTTAIVSGIPGFYDGPRHIAAPVAARLAVSVEDPPRPIREDWLRRLAWALWTEDELRDGTAWRHVTASLRGEQ